MATKAMSNQNPRLQQPQWSGRGHIAIFVRSLHHLDLDLFEDWPGVNEQLFTAKVAQQNLQQRVKAVEWSLYRLFEIYDPEEAKDKLRPFFPPIAPLQSINLRAALYRCLTELKKNGILGREIVLRKTMLDDCKGDRFEEAIANFAMVVLRKMTSVPQHGEETLAMILAHRGSLHNNFRDRKETNAATQQRFRQLGAMQINLEERLKQAKACSVEIDAAQQKTFRALINENWIGRHAWTDALLQGAPVQSESTEGDSLDATKIGPQSDNLIANLDCCVQKHQARLSEWKVTAKDLISKRTRSNPTVEVGSHLAKKDLAVQPRFLKHKEVNEANWKVTSTMQEPQDESYGRLRNAMRHELKEQSLSTKRYTEGRKNDVLLSSKSSLKATPVTASGGGNEVLEEALLSEEAFDPERATPLILTTSERAEPSGQYEASNSPSPIQDSDIDSPWVPTQEYDTKPRFANISVPTKDSGPTCSEEHDPPMSPSRLWLSLADRTRASMSLTSRQSILTDPDSPTNQGTDQAKSHVLPDIRQLSDDEDDRHASLVERTRKSMSLLSSSSVPRARKTKNNSEKRISQIYPINQFETPGRLQRQTDWTPGSGASTPKEQLFDEDAEYASIFKSRPKLALSPAFSPERRISGLDSILEQDMEQLNLGSEEGID